MQGVRASCDDAMETKSGLNICEENQFLTNATSFSRQLFSFINFLTHIHSSSVVRLSERLTKATLNDKYFEAFVINQTSDT